jgi:probable F420-dependent oxidoreductase
VEVPGICDTPPMRPFRFLADVGEICDGHVLAQRARRAEAIGYDVIVIPDHLVEQMSPIPALAVAAAATERLRVGSFVFNNDLRHPAVLAQDLATLDVLSGGRLEIGIGAGWNRPEYDAIGLPFDPVPVRQARLGEALAVLKGCFGPGPFSFAGSYYLITDLDLFPKPVQRPHPPIFVGGGGRRTLELAAREAQIVGLAPRLLPGVRTDPRSITLAATAEKIEWVRAAAGDRFAQLEFNVYPSMAKVSVTDRARAEAREVAAQVRSRTGVEISEDELLESPHIFIGSIASLVEKFTMLRERLGITSIMVGDMDALAPVVERLAGSRHDQASSSR